MIQLFSSRSMGTVQRFDSNEGPTADYTNAQTEVDADFHGEDNFVHLTPTLGSERNCDSRSSATLLSCRSYLPNIQDGLLIDSPSLVTRTYFVSLCHSLHCH